jgi:hypothetical protein
MRLCVLLCCGCVVLACNSRVEIFAILTTKVTGFSKNDHHTPGFSKMIMNPLSRTLE